MIPGARSNGAFGAKLRPGSFSKRLGLLALIGLGCLGLGTSGLAAPAEGDTAARFDVRLLGVKVGQMTLAGRIRAGAYVVTSEFSTTGVAGRLARAGFDLSARGKVDARGFVPERYDEYIDTGRRKSSARLRYARGVPRITGGTLASEAPDPGDTPLDPAREGGTLDPLTAMFAALHDQPAEALCRVNVTVFDGARRSEIVMAARSDAGDGTVTCSGTYRRLGGFSARELERQTVFPFTVTYAPGGGRMQARHVSMRSSYGKAELLRR